MPLDLLDQGGNLYIKSVKVDGKDGKITWARENHPAEVFEKEEAKWHFVADLPNLQQRWICFPQRSAREASPPPLSWPLKGADGSILPEPEIPGQKVQRGFELLTFTPERFKDGEKETKGVRRWRANSFSANKRMSDLYSSWEEKISEDVSLKGKLPVIYMELKPEATKHGDIWVPVMKITSFKDRTEVPGLCDNDVILGWLKTVDSDTPLQFTQNTNPAPVVAATTAPTVLVAAEPNVIEPKELIIEDVVSISDETFNDAAKGPVGDLKLI
tara:strand:- start:250 stop:1065 length:816 start_codon:yes stop_codon:yes gene_type:complete